MADKTSSYPMLPAKSWWALRKKFQSTMPGKITPSYLSTELGISSESAKNNVLPYLRVIDLIDDENKPTPLANDWRFNEKYQDVCKTIRSKIYDQELIDLFPASIEDRDPLEKWFSAKTSSGTVAARRMATFFELLTKADPSEGDVITQKKPSAIKTRRVAKEQLSKSTTTQQPKQSPSDLTPPVPPIETRQSFPSLHIDIQIHISPQASDPQIDKVFESMAKHLKDLYNSTKKPE